METAESCLVATVPYVGGDRRLRPFSRPARHVGAAPGASGSTCRCPPGGMFASSQSDGKHGIRLPCLCDVSPCFFARSGARPVGRGVEKNCHTGLMCMPSRTNLGFDFFGCAGTENGWEKQGGGTTTPSGLFEFFTSSKNDRAISSPMPF